MGKGRVRGGWPMGVEANVGQCFKTQDELVVAYSITPAFG
jgi:hypothetical protein